MDKVKAEVLNNIFASVFIDNLSSHIYWADGPQGMDWRSQGI